MTSTIHRSCRSISQLRCPSLVISPRVSLPACDAWVGCSRWFSSQLPAPAQYLNCDPDKGRVDFDGLDDVTVDSDGGNSDQHTAVNQEEPSRRKDKPEGVGQTIGSHYVANTITSLPLELILSTDRGPQLQSRRSTSSFLEDRYLLFPNPSSKRHLSEVRQSFPSHHKCQPFVDQAP